MSRDLQHLVFHEKVERLRPRFEVPDAIRVLPHCLEANPGEPDTLNLHDASDSLHLTSALHLQACRRVRGAGITPAVADPQQARLGDKFDHPRSQMQQADMPALQRM